MQLGKQSNLHVWHQWSRLTMLTLLLAGAGCSVPAMSALPTRGAKGCVTSGEPISVQTVRSIRGGPVAGDPLRPGAGSTTRGLVALVRPTQVAARGNDIFVVDAALQQLLHIDRALGTVNTFAALSGVEVTGLYVSTGLDLYVADLRNRRVLQFARNGRLVRTFVQPQSLFDPVGVAVLANGDRIIVGDALKAQIVVFLSVGSVAQVIGETSGAPRPIQSIAALTLGPDGIYVLARSAHRVSVLASDGTYRYAVGEDQLRLPVALAVDRYNRVFVADQSGNTITAFTVGQARGQPLRISGASAPFQQISDLWLQEPGMLYVADTAGARVDVLLVPPPCR